MDTPGCSIDIVMTMSKGIGKVCDGNIGHGTVVQECILAGTNAIYDFSCFVIKTIISRYFGILRICEFHLPLNQTLFYTCTDVPNLTYHDFCKIHIKF